MQVHQRSRSINVLGHMRDDNSEAVSVRSRRETLLFSESNEDSLPIFAQRT